MRIISSLYGILPVAALLATACSADVAVESPQLSVATEHSRFAAGETVRFALDGEADYVLFYSGEVGNDYAYSDKDRIYPVTLETSFSSRLEGGCQLTDILSVKYSTDFSGEYTADAIAAATWADITDSFVIPTTIPSDNVTSTPSGALDLTDLAAESTPFYVAFKYNIAAYDPDLGNERTNVYIYDFNVRASYADGYEDLVTQATAGWQFVLLGEGYAEDPYGPNSNASRLCLKCGAKPAFDREAWAVSARITPRSEVNTGTDKAVSAKVYYDAFPSSFEHAYTSCGDYVAVFEAINVTADGRKSVICKVPVSVVETSDIEGGGSIGPVEGQTW